MKTISQLQLTRPLRLHETLLAVLITCFAAGLVATQAAPPSLQPLLPGKWPTWPRGGYAQDVKVMPFTLETATNLNAPITRTPLLTTNVSAMPFDYVDFDVKLSDKPQK